MKYTAVQVIGVLLLVVGAQGAIRLLADHADGGFLQWLPGGFGPWMFCYAIAVVAGGLSAAWAARKGKGK
ncbi:hypothetical protein ACFWYW_11390 [Nonomuraea sp. NPDC059023]|uniref:hypothetical protein n=1 Tax=unclassified Nonomuraea TaxID=2593643 RepID=UPI0036A04957